jgi:hypothetical protein
VATKATRIPYAELHAHTNFSFLDGASALTSWSPGPWSWA